MRGQERLDVWGSAPCSKHERRRHQRVSRLRTRASTWRRTWPAGVPLRDQGESAAEVRDPGDGHIIQTVTVSGFSDRLCGTSGDPLSRDRGITDKLLAREAFDRHFTRVVASSGGTQEQADVGYQDVSTGAVTDISSADRKDQSFPARSFSDLDPVFSPSTDHLFFVRQFADTAEVDSVDLNSGKRTPVAQLPRAGAGERDQLVVSEKSDVVIDYQYLGGGIGSGGALPSPDGSLVVATSGPGDLGGGVQIAPVSAKVTVLTDDMTGSLNLPGAKEITTWQGESNPAYATAGGTCRPEAWVGDSAIVCNVGPNLTKTPGLYLGLLNVSTYVPQVPANILPLNDRRNGDVVVSGHTAYFLSEAGSGTGPDTAVGIYATNLDAPGQPPRQIAPLATGAAATRDPTERYYLDGYV